MLLVASTWVLVVLLGQRQPKLPLKAAFEEAWATFHRAR
jgi:hypothetical protein